MEIGRIGMVDERMEWGVVFGCFVWLGLVGVCGGGVVYGDDLCRWKIGLDDLVVVGNECWVVEWMMVWWV